MTETTTEPLTDQSPGIIFSTPWMRPDDGWCIASRAYARAIREAGIRVNLQDTVDVSNEWASLSDIPASIVNELGPIIHDTFHPRIDYHIYSGVLQSWKTMKNIISSFHHSPVPVGYYCVFERRTIESELINALKDFSIWCQCRMNESILKGYGHPDVTLIPYPYREDDPHLSIPLPPTTNFQPRFYWIGRFEPRKAPDNLVRAFMRAFKPGEARLTLKLSPYLHDGKGSYYENPERVVLEELELSNRWSVDNWMHDIDIIRKRLSAQEMVELHADNYIYVSPSRGEGLELGCWDAKLSGRLIIATESGGPDDYLDDCDIRIPATRYTPTHESYDRLWGKSHYIDYDLERLIVAMQQAASPALTTRFWEGHESHKSVNVGKALKTWILDRS